MGLVDIKGKNAKSVSMFFGKEVQVFNFRKLLDIPLAKGIINKESIKADLFELCSNTKAGRTSNTEITFFKSVEHALEDLVAAAYFYKNLQFKI